MKPQFAFFPGYPWLLRIISPGSLDVRVMGLVVGLAASLVATVAFWHLCLAVHRDPRVAWWSTSIFLVAPMSLFMSLVYTEPVFLACAIGAWLAATRERWVTAGLLAAAACTIRAPGVMLVAGLVLLWALGGRRRLRDLLPLALGPALVAMWFVWLHHRTGVWNAWTIAQSEGFDRKTMWPWVGARRGWLNATSQHPWSLRLIKIVDLVTVASTVLLTGLTWRSRQWAMALYATLSTVPLVMTNTYLSAARLQFAIFPFFILFGIWARNRPRWAGVIVAFSGAGLAMMSWFWGNQWWVG